MWMGFAVGILVSLALLHWGWRGRRVGDHPTCHGCGFDLTGLPTTSERCPECGRDVSRAENVATGTVERGRRRIGVGLLMLVCLSAAMISVAAHALREHGVLHYLPTWWLTRQVDSTHYAPTEIAAELEDRLENRKLSNAAVAAIAERALAVQRGGLASSPELTAANQFVQTAHWLNQLSAEQWHRFVHASIELSLRARPFLRPGDPLPLAVEGRAPALTLGAELVFLDLQAMKIDEADVTAKAFHPGWSRPNEADLEMAHDRLGQRLWQLDRHVTESLAPGQHWLHATVQATTFDWNDVPSAQDTRQEGLPDPNKRVDRFTISLSSPFAVYAAAHEPSLFSQDPRLKAAMEKSVEVDSVWIERFEGKPYVNIPISFLDNPLPVCFEVWIRPSGQEEWTIRDDGFRTEYSHDGLYTHYTLAGDLGEAEFADVKLWPNPNGFRDSLDDLYVWGHDIDFPHVPVRRKLPATRP